MIIKIFEILGKNIIQRAKYIGQLLLLLWKTICYLNKINIKLAFRQMAHLGVNSLPIVSLTMLFTGMVITIQIANEFIKYNAQSSVGGLIAISTGRELAPVLTGIVMAGRAGAAIAAEIGLMKITEQIDALKVMATNPIVYLVLPRLVACIFMVPILTIFANVIGVIGGYLVSTIFVGLESYTFINSVETLVIINDITGGLIKAMFFGVTIAIVGCFKGLNAGEGAEGVGKATTDSVVSSIIIIFVSNYFLSILLY